MKNQINLKLTMLACITMLTLVGMTATAQNAIEAKVINRPLIIGKGSTEIMTLQLNDKNMMGKSINSIQIAVTPKVSAMLIENATLEMIGTVGSARRETIGTGKVKNGVITFSQPININSNDNLMVLSLTPRANANLTEKMRISKITVKMADKSTFNSIPSNGDVDIRMGYLLRAAGEDHINTYRIPGLATTNKGTLIAVYDNRYENSKDLQGKIKIGMSRSTNGGDSWEPMKVVMDMKNYGGQPETLNGVTDPSVLFDPTTNTIWVAALWMSGGSKDQMAWWASKPGMEPTETGQFLLVKSTDDGITWSEPINITSQIKDPAWQLILQGPGKGITMRDGTLVFPAQFKADIGKKAIDGGQYSCHSTIVYSKDSGKSWHIGSGAKDNTTECQVIELENGTLMLNMRDDRNRSDKGDTNGRAVATTTDMGKTWTVHPSSNHALPESNCQASIIEATMDVKGKQQRVLFFSNPNTKQARNNMTIKVSLDDGNTWANEHQLLLNQDHGFGYSCLTMIDNHTIGIIYEGSHDIIFQKIKVSDLIK